MELSIMTIGANQLKYECPFVKEKLERSEYICAKFGEGDDNLP